MNIIFIRHGKTLGNEENRYIGATDEELSPMGIEEITKKNYPEAERIAASPMKRCIQTAQLIYGRNPEIFDDLRECDFGNFENKNYEELKNNEEYTAFLNGENMTFPNGENPNDFCVRCCRCFEAVVNNDNSESIAFVVHGGTIMAILEKYAAEGKGFYHWQVKNGEGFVFEKINTDGRIVLKFKEALSN